MLTADRLEPCRITVITPVNKLGREPQSEELSQILSLELGSVR
jgi:hypothetical protein